MSIKQGGLLGHADDDAPRREGGLEHGKDKLA